MKTVEVFKTNIDTQEQSQPLLLSLTSQFPNCRINFDLDDCDRILRVEGENFAATLVMQTVRSHGFICEALV